MDGREHTHGEHAPSARVRRAAGRRIEEQDVEGGLEEATHGWGEREPAHREGEDAGGRPGALRRPYPPAERPPTSAKYLATGR